MYCMRQFGPKVLPGTFSALHYTGESGNETFCAPVHGVRVFLVICSIFVHPFFPLFVSHIQKWVFRVCESVAGRRAAGFGHF